MNRFEDVSSDDHQKLVAGGIGVGSTSGIWGWGGLGRGMG